jgi:hypothetical protein
VAPEIEVELARSKAFKGELATIVELCGGWTIVLKGGWLGVYYGPCSSEE